MTEYKPHQSRNATATSGKGRRKTTKQSISMQRVASQLPLEMARLRLRTRFQTKFPNVAITAVKKQPPVMAAKNDPSSSNNKLEHLEAARQRLRSRLAQKFPLVTTHPSTCSGTMATEYRSPKQEPDSFVPKDQQHQHDGAVSSPLLEAARHRIHERFQKKFLPDFQDFPTSVDEALESLQRSRRRRRMLVLRVYSSRWSDNNAVVITSATAPYPIVQVNHAWEQLCGYTQAQAVGQTFHSLGIQDGSFTQRHHTDMLAQKLQRRERAALHLTNAAADGHLFQNYLRVAPLVDHRQSNQVTHFIGVLQDDTSSRMKKQQSM